MTKPRGLITDWATPLPRIDLSWREQGNCWNTDSLVFIPVIYPNGHNRSVYATALSLCRDCRVKRQCADFAIATKQDAGVWGGMIPTEIVKARRRKRRDSNRS